MDIIIVCHTEYGEVKNKRVVATKNSFGVVVGVKRLDEIARKHGAKVTYAVCPEVATDFPNGIDGEIGLHIHPGWQEFKRLGIKYYVGDTYLKANCEQSSNSTLLTDYSYLEQYWMINKGKKHIIRTLGKVPTVFVAGRWSINNNTVWALVNNGFTHDCSATRGKEHYDWSKLPRICLPYNPSESDYQEKGDLPLLITPISQCFFIGGNVNIELVPDYDLLWLQFAFFEHYYRKVPIFHICLHSPCMGDDYFINTMDALLKFIAKHKVNFKFVSEISKYGRKVEL